jgi:hypothetical protein
VPSELLDDYFKDVFKSFFLFFLAIGPVIYIEYFKKEVKPEVSEDGMIVDKYANMLKQIKQNQSDKKSET